MDRSLEQSLSIMEELLTQRGVFQCLMHFSSSQATIWTVNDPFRYRLLDQEALSGPDVCLVYPQTPYPIDAAIPQQCVSPIGHIQVFDLLVGTAGIEPARDRSQRILRKGESLTRVIVGWRE